MIFNAFFTMDSLIRLFLLVFSVGVIGGCAAIHGEPPLISPPDIIVQKGDWQLFIYYKDKGTRSETQYGRLLFKDEPVEAQERGETIQTDLGAMKYYGEEGETRWGPRGWNFCDPAMIRNSWDLDHEAGEST